MKRYGLINNILGWVAFLIATIVYVMTIEPTTSFWDCGEFIATAFKLEVGHPPGAPLFMILARFFSLFAGDDVTQVAKMVNIMSALASSFTILFLFWTITHLAKKMIIGSDEASLGKIIAVMGSGLVGALAYTFSDTFWFSAVEGEVYASSSLFTAVVFWAILKWENVADEKYANRWIILIAYLMGLSIGVHLLNLLAIPAIVFVYYFKKHEVTKKGVIYASLVSVILLGAIMYGIIPGVVTIASWFELLFINTLGMPFNTGVIIYIALLLGSIILGLHNTSKGESSILNVILFTIAISLLGIPFMLGSIFMGILLIGVIFAAGYYLLLNKPAIINTILLAFTVILIGYSSFSMIVIRSNANPPMDENNPDNVFALLSYLNREQYGDRPLFYGQSYNAPLDIEERYTKGDPVYIQKDGKYVISDYKESPNFNPQFKSIFPRMYSSQGNHVKEYQKWADIKGKPVRARNNQGEMETFQVPTFAENIKFFIKYQVGFMYFRYFMWNFAGRQNDIQGHGGITNGNWISGIPFIDDARLGPQDKLPEEMAKNKGKNKYYFLPLILGLIGLIYQFKKNQNDFWLVTLLFFFTGLAIVIYLNQYPLQPRERDYAYAGSFYAFAIWIGLGVLGVYKLLKKGLPKVASASIATVLCLALVPGIMASENWDDHDRSDRYTARDFARNYLESCAPNAILFTNGDNDTFPLWYAQEVEGIRTDVRVVNLSLLNTDWYIDQMKRKAYDSDAVPFSLTHDKYVQGTRDVVYLIEDPRIKGYVDIDKIMEFIASDSPATKHPQDPEIDYSPSKKLRVPVDSAKVVNNGTVRPEDADKILPYLDWDINKSYITKSELMILDLLATNNWERPVYFAITVGTSSYLNLEEYFQLEGLAYRLVPIRTKNKDGQLGNINLDRMYDNMVNKFEWGGINNPDVYLDENNLRMTMNLRNNFARLAEGLLKEGRKDSAITVLDKALEIMPHETVPYNYFILGIAREYYNAGETEKANNIIKKLAEISNDELAYYFSLNRNMYSSIEGEAQRSMAVMQELVRITRVYNQTELTQELEIQFRTLYEMFSNMI